MENTVASQAVNEIASCRSFASIACRNVTLRAFAGSEL